MNHSKKSMALMIFLALSAVLFLCANNDQEAVRETGTPAAGSFELTDLEGNTLTLENYRGKVIILDFWDTWCPPCRKEIPDFIALQDEYGSEGFVVIGVAFGREGVEKVKAFAEEMGINYPVAVATEEIMKSYGPIQAIPTTFILDKNGRIYQKYTGYREKSVFRNDILKLLK